MDTTDVIAGIALFTAFVGVVGPAMVVAIASLKNWKRARGAV